MTLKLEDVFTGERGRSLEAQRESIVDHGPAGIKKLGPSRNPGHRHLAEHPLRDLDNARSRYANDSDSTAPRRGGDGRDRVAGTGMLYRQLGTSPCFGECFGRDVRLRRQSCS